MQKNLRAKTLAIIAILVVFVYGIFGLPHGVSGTALKAALLKNINLGLDLKGGTHLVLQVMVDEAVGSATDSDAGAIQTDLQQNGIQGVTVTKPDPGKQDMIQLAGVPAAKSSDLSSVLNGRYGSRYDITPGVNTATVADGDVARGNGRRDLDARRRARKRPATGRRLCRQGSRISQRFAGQRLPFDVKIDRWLGRATGHLRTHFE